MEDFKQERCKAGFCCDKLTNKCMKQFRKVLEENEMWHFDSLKHWATAPSAKKKLLNLFIDELNMGKLYFT